MIFTLEALNAEHGDSLLLHYGTPATRKLIVIDGGPSNVFHDTLGPRLDALRATRAGGGALGIRLAMVSHIDDDHINGILDLMGAVLKAEEDSAAAPYDVTTLWHNSFDDLVKKAKVADLHLLAARAKGKSKLGQPAAAVVASVTQGRDLRNAAKKLGINLNTPFGGLIVAPTKGAKTVDLGNGLSFTVIGPRQAQLDALQTDWATKIAALKKKGALKPAALEAVAAEFVDKSVYNLSSIVVLAEAGGHRMLLTGDARGDFVLDGLTAAGLLKTPPLHVDVFKLPHHGSIRNAAAELFAKITADHYVVSANGKYGNPDAPTLKLLTDARGKDAYTIHLTNKVAKAVTFLDKAKAGKKFKVVVRGAGPSIRVDLGDALPD